MTGYDTPYRLGDATLEANGGDDGLPLVIRGDDADPVAWAADHRDAIDALLLRHGAIRFDGFGLTRPDLFGAFVRALSPNLFSMSADLTRVRMADGVYLASPYPEDQPIRFHNEASHNRRWPMRQYFGCIVPALSGGETPLADSRRIYARLDPALRRRFETKHLLYVRNFIPGLDVTWQTYFKTEDRAEAASRAEGARFEWRDGGVLRMMQPGPAAAFHPRTGDRLFFNQILLHHVACLDAETRDALRDLFDETDLPRNVCYGDGSPIEDSVVREIDALYSELSVAFSWQPGQAVVVDNMLTAHMRNPYRGPRTVITTMAEPIEADAVRTDFQ